MNAEIYGPLGERVARLRKRIDLTQEALGNKVNMSRATIASIEAGRQRVTLDQLYEISSALELKSLSDLIPLDVAQYEALEPSLQGRVNAIQAAQIDTLLRSALAGSRVPRKRD